MTSLFAAVFLGLLHPASATADAIQDAGKAVANAEGTGTAIVAALNPIVQNRIYCAAADQCRIDLTIKSKSSLDPARLFMCWSFYDVNTYWWGPSQNYWEEDRPCPFTTQQYDTGCVGAACTTFAVNYKRQTWPTYQGRDSSGNYVYTDGWVEWHSEFRCKDHLQIEVRYADGTPYGEHLHANHIKKQTGYSSDCWNSSNDGA